MVKEGRGKEGELGKREREKVGGGAGERKRERIKF